MQFGGEHPDTGDGSRNPTHSDCESPSHSLRVNELLSPDCNSYPPGVKSFLRQEGSTT
jgi:hypothetical protein